MQARRTVGDDTVLFELTSGNGGIVLGNGTIDVRISAQETSAYAWKNGVWDLELIAPDGTVTRLLEGGVSVSPEVTRD